MGQYKIMILSVYTKNISQDSDDLVSGSLAAYLRQYGYTVKIIAKLKDRINIEEIRKYNPDIVGISVYRDNIDDVIEMSRELKENIPHASICYGGVLPTNYKIELMKSIPYLDFIIKGEGEIAFHNLIIHLEQKWDLKDVKSLVYRNGTEIIENENEQLIADLNTLPFPARDALVENNIKVANVSTARGCCWKCKFCESSKYWVDQGLQKWRGQSIERMVDEIEYINSKHNISLFRIVNNSFEDSDKNINNIVEFAECTIKRNIKATYSILLRSSFYKKVTDDVLRLMEDSGISNAFIGVESANQNDLKLFGKNNSIEDNVKCVQFFRKTRINPTIGFINFHPYSTIESMRDNIEYLKLVECASYFTMLRAIYIDKGTELFYTFKNDNLLIDRLPGRGYDYRFNDHRIGKLYGFINSYFKEDPKHFQSLNIIWYVERDLLPHVFCLMNLFYNTGKVKAYESVKMAIQDIDHIFKAINENNYLWFSKLLDLAENDCDEKKMLELSDEYVNIKTLEQVTHDLNKVKNYLYRQLLRCGEEYESFII